MSIGLLVIDIQNDYFPGGAMELSAPAAAAANAAMLLDVFRRKELPVIHIQHIATRPGATFFLPGTAGAEIHEAVHPLAKETLFEKHFPNAFRETPLLEHLRNAKIDRLVIAGMMTHMCVDTTTRAASDYGFSCQLAHDACATRNLSFGGIEVAAPNVQTAYLAALHGSFATVLSSNDVAASL